MDELIRKKLVSIEPVEGYVLICVDKKKREYKYVHPKLLQLMEDYTIEDLMLQCARNKNEIKKLTATLVALVESHNALIKSINAKNILTDAKILNYENAIKELGGKL